MAGAQSASETSIGGLVTAAIRHSPEAQQAETSNAVHAQERPRQAKTASTAQSTSSVPATMTVERNVDGVMPSERRSGFCR
jgi:hypothetical protein